MLGSGHKELKQSLLSLLHSECKRSRKVQIIGHSARPERAKTHTAESSHEEAGEMLAHYDVAGPDQPLFRTELTAGQGENVFKAGPTCHRRG